MDIDWDDFDIEEIDNKYKFIINSKQKYQRDKYVYIMLENSYFNEYKISSKRKIKVRDINMSETRRIKKNTLLIRYYHDHRWITTNYSALIKKYPYLDQF